MWGGGVGGTLTAHGVVWGTNPAGTEQRHNKYFYLDVQTARSVAGTRQHGLLSKHRAHSASTTVKLR